jgi:RNA polymerase sigma factor (TIGR02999 family)
MDPIPVSTLIARAHSGEQAALDQLLPLVYDELRKIARRYMRFERKEHTLQATALVHEAFLRLAGNTAVTPKDRTHFVALAATAMRRILVEHARGRNAIKRGGEVDLVRLEDAIALAHDDSTTFLAIDEALNEFRELDPERAKVFELHFVFGMQMAEIADAMDLSAQQVRYKLDVARAWMRGRLAGLEQRHDP